MTRRGLGRRLTAALLAGGVVVAVAAPASAAAQADGLWYFDALNIQAAHDSGHTGEGVTVAVLDSPINPDIPTLQSADLRVDPTPRCFDDGEPAPVESTHPGALHGTNVASLIVGSGAEGGVKGVAPGATLLYYAVRGAIPDADGNEVCEDASGEPNYAQIADALDAAVDAGADIISLSIAVGPGDGAYEAITRALARDVIIVAGLPNQDPGESLLEQAPFTGTANGVVNVQAIDSTGAVLTHEGLLGESIPNRDERTDVAAPGVGILHQGDPEGDWSRQTVTDGTSFATPIVAGFLAVVSERYPDATPNQLIQTLIRNTGVDDHELAYDPDGFFGYGFVSLTHMLRVDPTQYPDENPLLTADGLPSPEEIQAAVETPPAETPAPRPSGESFPVLPVLLGVVGGIVVFAGVGVAIAFAARRRARV